MTEMRPCWVLESWIPVWSDHCCKTLSVETSAWLPSWGVIPRCLQRIVTMTSSPKLAI